ncbi:MAG: hypothetical protein IPK83_16675 [Planctomycetes bacterium]|nr:hypothetical protein [Planctomycetota bacterium]
MPMARAKQIFRNCPLSFYATATRSFFHDSPDLTDDKGYEARIKKEFNEEEAMIAQGGRMVFDKSAGKLKMTGVLDANHRDRMLRATAPDSFITEIKKVAAETAKAKAEADTKGEKSFTVEHRFENLPEGFDAGYLRGFDPEKIRFDAAERKLILKTELADNQYKQILVAAADPEFRRALNELFVASVKFRVSSMWLFWFYILCTIGELCLSPVGLSMVSKLAPRRFATMLMGMWLLTSFFGNFAAGLAGENWERLDPGSYFTYITIAMVIAAAICYGLAKRITSMMHGAN